MKQSWFDIASYNQLVKIFLSQCMMNTKRKYLGLVMYNKICAYFNVLCQKMESKDRQVLKTKGCNGAEVLKFWILVLLTFIHNTSTERTASRDRKQNAGNAGFKWIFQNMKTTS